MLAIATGSRDESLAEYNQRLDDFLRRYSYMNLRAWKLLKNLVVSGLVFYLALEAGADPTMSVLVIALINGIDLSELAALRVGNRNGGDDGSKGK